MALCLCLSQVRVLTKRLDDWRHFWQGHYLWRILHCVIRKFVHLQNKVTSLLNFVPNSGLENFATACRSSQRVVNFVWQRRTLVYIGWTDLTESMVPTRSPFSGYNICGVKGRRFIVIFHYNAIRWFIQMSVWSLTCRQSVFKRYHSGKHFSELYPQNGGENQQA